MVLKFNPLKTRAVKNNGNYIFGDFSHGLYLLDTPRTINEQLASLALTGGRNVMAEKGALIPQFGYMKLAQLPDDEIVAAVTKDSYSSSSFYLLTYSGNVYLYTANQGLKKFKTTLPTVDNPIVAHRGSDLIVRTEGNNYIFGAYDKENTNEIINSDIQVNDFSSYYTFKVPMTDLQYYWNGKQLCVNDTYQVNITGISEPNNIGTFKKESFTFPEKGFTLDNVGNITFSQPNIIVSQSGDAVDLTGKSFVLKGSCWGGDGTGEYSLGGMLKLIVTTSNKQTTLNIQGEASSSLINVSLSNQYSGIHKFEILFDKDLKKLDLKYERDKNNIELVATHTLTDTETFTNATGILVNIQPTDILNKYMVDLKQFKLKVDETETWSGSYLSSEGYAIVRAVYVSGGDNRPSLSGNVTLGERTLKNITLAYEAESGTTGNKTLEPEMFAVASNRLFVVDENGSIYYSSIGVIDDFKQSNGAGFFSGFYSDTSKTLSIEDYMDGVLICKENGLYYLTISDNSTTIKKIANIGQESANDHVIVRESVYAYDSNSGSIVNAASVNIFGSIVAGNTIIDSTYLDSQGRGISTSPRWLTYNGLENVMILYYGEDYRRGMLLNLNSNLYPRELDIPVKYFIGFNQGVTGITADGEIFQDFKNGTIIEGLNAYADFEAIGLRDNRMVISSMLEITELNGVDYTVTTTNSISTAQKVEPVIGLSAAGTYYPELLYSDYSKNLYNNTYELTSRWADKKASLTRIYAPMSGRNGVGISIEFPKDVSFCLAALRLPDFSQGE